MKTINSSELSTTYVRLRANATTELLPVDASFWERISSGALGSFHNEYMVSCYSFTSDWPMWEMHPHGDEIVCLLSGEVTFMMDDGNEIKVAPLTESTSNIAYYRWRRNAASECLASSGAL